FFDDRTLVDGGYWSENRRGDAVFYPIPSLSIGALCVTPGMFDSHRDLSNVLAELKKAAKKLPGNQLFVDRRQQAPELAEPNTADSSPAALAYQAG
ncbi:MAG: hypothetical protein ACYC22_08495, partial [Thiomonas delicata]